MIQPHSGNQSGNRQGCYQGICGYCSKQGHHEKECFKKKLDSKHAQAPEEEGADDTSELSEEHVMMMFEPANNLSDNSSAEYIEFKAEQKLFKHFNPKVREDKQAMIQSCRCLLTDM